MPLRRTIVKQIKQRHRVSHGQALVELCFCLPFLLICLVTILLAGRYFHTQQVVDYATRQAAQIARRTPDLCREDVRESLLGFDKDGKAVNSQSIVYHILSAGGLLSSGSTGDLPDGASISIAPFDAAENVPSGAVRILIEYPFQSGNSGFLEYKIRSEATTSLEIFQEGV